VAVILLAITFGLPAAVALLAAFLVAERLEA
jgi:hypothetical protein